MQSAELRIPEPKKKIRSTTGGAAEKRHVVSTGYETRMPSTAQRSCSPVACNMQSAELHIPEPKKKSRPKTERAIEKKQVVLTDRTGHHQTVQRRKRSCSPVACNMQSAELRIPEPKKKNTIDDWRSYGEETRFIHWL